MAFCPIDIKPQPYSVAYLVNVGGLHASTRVLDTFWSSNTGYPNLIPASSGVEEGQSHDIAAISIMLGHYTNAARTAVCGSAARLEPRSRESWPDPLK